VDVDHHHRLGLRPQWKDTAASSIDDPQLRCALFGLSCHASDPWCERLGKARPRAGRNGRVRLRSLLNPSRGRGAAAGGITAFPPATAGPQAASR
jgi:hypothetical protein